MREIHTLVISDVHLGSPVCMAQQLRAVLRHLKFKRLVLLGDIFDSLDFSRLCGKQWKLFEEIRRVAKNRPVVWLAGNHDVKAFEFGCAMTGASPVPEDGHHVEEVNGRQFYMVHGHQFDEFIPANPVITAVASSAYMAVQQMEPSQVIARAIKRGAKKWMRVDEKVGEGATAAAKSIGIDVAVCGHTHHAGISMIGKLTYINSGCWTDIPATMVAIDVKGRAVLCQVGTDGGMRQIAKA